MEKIAIRISIHEAEKGDMLELVRKPYEKVSMNLSFNKPTHIKL